MIRNEVDLVRLNVLYHLSLGIDRMLIVDNGSTDGTGEVLRQLGGQDSRVRWTYDPGPYRQTEIMTGLAREAYREGADWIVQIDADEFWHAPAGDFRKVLETSEAGVLAARTPNFIQHRGQKRSSPDALLYMTRRCASPVKVGRAKNLIESQQLAYVETRYPRKCLSRPTEEIRIEAGNHHVSGAKGHRERTRRIICLHAPIRSRDSLEERVRTSHRPAEAGRKPNQGWYRAMLGNLEDESAVGLEWAANSYEGDHLDVYGEQHPVIFDPMLRDAVAPWIKQPLWKRASRLLSHTKEKG